MKLTAYIIFTTLFVASLISCASKETVKNNNSSIGDTAVSGRYVNFTFLKNVTEKLPEEIPWYCFELNFLSTDSVEVFGGFEEYKLAYKKQGNGFVLIDATFKGDMFFTIKDSVILLQDIAWTGIAGHSEFKRVPEPSTNKWLFDSYYREQIIAGEYELLKKDETSSSEVVFKADGSVTGFLNYTRYDVCYSGDCIGTTSEPAYIITFYGHSIAEDYAFTTDKKKREISLYEIAPPIEDIKGDRPIKDKVFTLKKQ